MIHVDGIIYTLQTAGGITTYTNSLLRRLSQRGRRFCVTLDIPCQGFPELRDGGSTGVDNEPRTIARRARLAERYRKARKVMGAAIFHSSYYRLTNDRRAATVVTVHDFIYERYRKGPARWVHTSQKLAAIQAADAIICVSEATRRDLYEFARVRDGQMVAVIYNGVSEDFFPLTSMAEGARPYILFVGERRGYKNFKKVVAALELLPDIELRCVGGGTIRSDELVNLPSQLRERIIHCGLLSSADLNRAYNGALCLVYPSSYEGFGIPVVEAMRAGCPVVSTMCDAVLEIGGSALTIAPEPGPRELADAIERTADLTYRRQVVAEGQKRAAEFSWEITHDKTISIYDAIRPQ